MVRPGRSIGSVGIVSAKTNASRFFEDFRLGETIRHATPRTVTLGDVAVYNGLFGPRFAVQSSDEFARRIGYARSPLDDLLVFNVVFGKTVPDISLNAVANLGYADCRFLKPVYPGATLSAVSEVIGRKENSNRKTGIVYVRSRGVDETGEPVLDYVRWVMVRKRDEATPAPGATVPDLPKAVPASALGLACPRIDARAYDTALSGSGHRFGDYAAGERIDHVDGVTVEEAEPDTEPTSQREWIYNTIESRTDPPRRGTHRLRAFRAHLVEGHRTVRQAEQHVATVRAHHRPRNRVVAAPRTQHV